MSGTQSQAASGVRNDLALDVVYVVSRQHTR